MKRFKGNLFLYLLLPSTLILMMTAYGFILFKRSYLASNILNISIDAIILLYYFLKFCRQVSRDPNMTYFSTIFKKYGVKNSAIINIRQSSFMTKFKTEQGNFYILTTEEGNKVILDIFGDKIKHKQQ